MYFKRKRVSSSRLFGLTKKTVAQNLHIFTLGPFSFYMPVFTVIRNFSEFILNSNRLGEFRKSFGVPCVRIGSEIMWMICWSPRQSGKTERRCCLYVHGCVNKNTSVKTLIGLRSGAVINSNQHHRTVMYFQPFILMINSSDSLL